MGEQRPTIGRIVHYRVSDHDGSEIRNNAVGPGEVLPAIVTRVWSAISVQLRVFCDGPTDAWKTSVLLGEEPGQWSWPPRI